jgi:uroporphyrin-III C-methyltransferase / precorrin-2 dehydrogenase / sirohydrochlorin ferrochelatase
MDAQNPHPDAQQYPIGLVLAGRRVLVVGGGAVATRRVPALLAAAAEVTLVSPSVTATLYGLAEAGRLTWVARPVVPTDLEGVWLAHVAVDDLDAARMVSVEAERRQIFCVRADDRHAASAWTPAVTRQGPVTVAVTAGGDSRRAMAVRDAIAAGFGDGWLDRVPDAGGQAGTGRAGTGQAVMGVALVGAGPGAADLITVRGRRLLAAADVVVVDRLVPGLLLDELGPDAEIIDASKIPYGPARSQEEINRLLVTHALAGRFVVRLKGGDPFVFGRGGEELLACAQAGIPVTVVPGVTSATAVPAAAGIPVTHRGVAHELVVVSGHVPPEDPLSLVDWQALARLRGTICVLMGLKNLDAIAATLVRHGRPPHTPAAVIQEGTTAHQKQVRGTLAVIAASARSAGIRSPALVVIGDTVDVLGVA